MNLRMGIALVTGSAGLIGSEAARRFADLGLQVVGVDNDMRKVFFGDDSSTAWTLSGRPCLLPASSPPLGRDAMRTGMLVGRAPARWRGARAAEWDALLRH